MLVDEAVAGDPEKFERTGDRELVGAVLEVACRLDAGAVAERRRLAEADRRTTLRPAPDTMTWFSALLPVKDGVAVHAALLAEADRKKAAGDQRSRGAIMADTLVQRVLAPSVAVDGPAELPLQIHVVVPDHVLLGDRGGGGHVDGYGPVPGDLLREWIASHAEQGVQDWVRRLYCRPATGELVAMDQKGRRFEGGLAQFLRLRDKVCRNPWCNAPIRHLDHAVDHAEGGATSAENAEGLCEACNHAKQASGWSARPLDAPVHTIEIVTPTGHRYRTTAPSKGPPLWMEIYPHATRVA
jgi:5-methylcytosine-specific restriction endonuclease McrA